MLCAVNALFAASLALALVASPVAHAAASSATATGAAARADAAYAPYLPPSVRAKALAALRSLDLSEEGLRAVASVTFASAESSTMSPEPILNRVQHLPLPGLDLWLMRQRQSAREGADEAHWSYVAILVDEEPQDGGRPTAYDLELAPRPVAKGALPQPIPPRVACYRCHANGPRAVRPMRGATLPPLDSGALALVRAWNASIERAGVVRNHLTDVGAAAAVYALPAAMEPLPLAKCKQCHDPATGVRSELRRLHGGSVSFLATHGDLGDGTMAAAAHATPILPADNPFLVGVAPRPAMPIEEEPLTADETHCLTAWLMDERPATSCFRAAVATTPAPASASSPADGGWIVDAETSTLRATVTTSVSSFVVDGLSLAGRARCDDEDRASLCHLDVSVALAPATTGLALRDRHMRERLSVARFAQALGHAGPVAWAMLTEPSGVTLPVTLMVAGASATTSITVRCASEPAGDVLRCSVAPFAWDMRAFGVEPPRFLGLTVAPRVLVEGQMRLRKG